jgi:hypothetical protein
MLGSALVWALTPVKPKALPYTKYPASSFLFLSYDICNITQKAI